MIMNRLRRKPYRIFSNLLQNRYITDGLIWTIDETIFNDDTKLFLVVSLNTKAILGFIQGKNCRNDGTIIELYEKILEDYSFQDTPMIVHSDMEETYSTDKILEYFDKKNIKISLTVGKKNNNQVSEAINNQIKYLVTKILLQDTNCKAFREFKSTLPQNLKDIRKKNCYSDKNYRNHLFKSRLFKSKQHTVIEEAISTYNKRSFAGDITRVDAQFLDSFISGRTMENTRLVKSGDVLAPIVKEDNILAIQQVQSQLTDILSADWSKEEKMTQILALSVLKQDNSEKLIQQGFIGIATFNKQILNDNQELKQQLEENRKETEKITRKLNKLLEKNSLAEERKLKRQNRRKRPRKVAITSELYDFLIEESCKIHMETYCGARLRLAITLLLITGVRVSELLPIKVQQLENLFKKGWIPIDRLKRGPSSHRGYLSPTGKKILKHRARDFEIIQYSKNNDSYIFTPQYKDNPLRREVFNKLINTFLKESSKKYTDQPNITSHSFRMGYITKLWKDTDDIEFVRQAIGHAKVNTTSIYVESLSDEEIKNRMNRLN